MSGFPKKNLSPPKKTQRAFFKTPFSTNSQNSCSIGSVKDDPMHTAFSLKLALFSEKKLKFLNFSAIEKVFSSPKNRGRKKITCPKKLTASHEKLGNQIDIPIATLAHLLER